MLFLKWKLTHVTTVLKTLQWRPGSHKLRSLQWPPGSAQLRPLLPLGPHPPPLSPRVSPLRHHWSPAGSSPSSARACPFLPRCFSARKTELAALVPSSSSGLCSNVNWAGPSDHPLWSQSLSATTVHWERSSLAPPQLDFALKHSLPSDVQYASFVHFRLLPLECVFVLFSFCSITVSSA